MNLSVNISLLPWLVIVIVNAVNNRACERVSISGNVCWCELVWSRNDSLFEYGSACIAGDRLISC